MKRPVIVSCGEVLWDLFREGARFGGAPANFACHAARLGAEVSILSAVGDDKRGDEAVAVLRKFDVDTSLVQRNQGAPTGVVEVEVDATGKPSFKIQAVSAWDGIIWSGALEARVAQADAIYFGTLGQRGSLSRSTIRRAIDLAKSRDILCVLDVNLRRPFHDAALIRESIGQANILKLSDEELPEVASACGIAPNGKPEVMLRTLLAKFALRLVVMTRGAEGALLVSAEAIIEQPGIATVVRDAVGAGDSFTAAFVTGLLRKVPPVDNLSKACEIASAVCAHEGAVPDLPYRKNATAEVSPRDDTLATWHARSDAVYQQQCFARLADTRTTDGIVRKARSSPDLKVSG